MHKLFIYFSGARFKRFQSQNDAKNYAENGDMFCKSPEISNKSESIGEPGSPFPSVSRIMFNRLKKSIESKVRKYMLHKFKKKKDSMPTISLIVCCFIFSLHFSLFSIFEITCHLGRWIIPGHGFAESALSSQYRK